MASPRSPRKVGGRFPRRDLGRRRGRPTRGCRRHRHPRDRGRSRRRRHRLDDRDAEQHRPGRPACSGTVGIGLDILVNIVNDTTQATIDAPSSRPRNRLRVIVRATRTPRTRTPAAPGASAPRGGGGVNVDVVHNDTEALIADTQPTATIPTEVDAGDGVEDQRRFSRRRNLPN